ncbi:hypothetical protein [Nocardioides ferulae]|uniref:hypothetical protein n=1 Tax=Nocardioides ferulae TaxID=2340821 RepID=UPI000EADE632|nr:hypothetical protein [Nocardioides ferulae]
MPGRNALVAMIPVNLLLVAWVWMGRVFFGVGGWFLLIFLLSLVPLLLMLLTISTVLAFTQPSHPGRPRSLTRNQVRSQAVLWAGLFVFGAFCPDFGDAPDSSSSLLTQIFGYSDTLLDVSGFITLAGGAVAVGGYIALLTTLTVGRRQPPPPGSAPVTDAR